MVYGRLDVYWPDGKLESFLLEDDTVSVGRAEGNDIFLDTDTISRYHFSLVHQDDTVSVTDLDSANGTYVDGMLLESNHPRELGKVEEIQVGALRIIFRMIDDAPTLPMRPAADETAQLESADAGFRVELDHVELDVWPAASSSVEIAITNTSDETQTFSTRISGMPGEWLRVNRPEMILDPDATGYVLVNIKPPRRHTTTPDTYHVTVEIEPADAPELSLQANLTVHVQAFTGFGMAMMPHRDPDDPATLFLHNQGSHDLTVSLSATDPQKALRFSLPNAPLTLQPGQRTRVDVGVRGANPPLVGNDLFLPFVVQARAHNAAGFIAAAGGRARIAPRFAAWQLMSAAGIALSIVAIGFVALLGLLAPGEPQLNDVQLVTEQVTAGDPLVIELQPQALESVDVAINDVLVQRGLAGDVTRISLDTSGYSGNLDIMLVGHGRNDTSIEQSLMAMVEPLLDVREFAIEPAPLVRNVVATLTIEWAVDGAAFVRFDGLNEFSNGLFRSSTQYDAMGELTGIGGIPAEPLTVTLYAEDANGNAVQESRTVPLIDPQCTATVEIPLREGPDPRYQQVATVPQDVTVTVLAQDAGAGWLRVQLPGEVRGWGARENFACAETFNVADLRTEANIPELPTLTPTDAAESTAEPTLPPTAVPTADPTATN